MEKPAKCSVCGKEAAFFATKVALGKLTEVPYCQKHAIEAGLLDPKAYAFFDDGTEAEALSGLQGPHCEKCGWSFRNFEKTGRMGCPSCYQVFGANLKPLLHKLQKNLKHAGKIPGKAVAVDLIKDRIKRLETQLEKAIARERYEEAATFRDKISQMKARVEGN